MADIVFNTPLGHFKVIEDGGFIQKMDLTNEPLKESRIPILLEAKRQMDIYMKKEPITFDLPLKPKGTPFQLKVWRAMCNIPYGSTASYKDLAIEIGNPKASRAIGRAVHFNPIFIVMPCHRVIGSNGDLVGFYGGLDLKRTLLDMEKAG